MHETSAPAYQGARREFVTHVSRRRSRLAMQSQLQAAQGSRGEWGEPSVLLQINHRIFRKPLTIIP